MNHEEWLRVADDEYRLLDELLVSLDPGQWALPTPCTEWNVRHIVAHLVGAAESIASADERTRQQEKARGRQGDRFLIDAVNEVQVEERANRAPDELVDDLRKAGRASVEAKRNLPQQALDHEAEFPPPIGRSTLGHLMDNVYTRDAWMHRLDVARAIDRHPALTAEHDGAIVADAADEWLRRANRDVTLTLTGPAGGSFSSGSHGAELQYDAIDFCRALSGRGALNGVEADLVVF